MRYFRLFMSRRITACQVRSARCGCLRKSVYCLLFCVCYSLKCAISYRDIKNILTFWVNISVKSQNSNNREPSHTIISIYLRKLIFKYLTTYICSFFFLSKTKVGRWYSSFEFSIISTQHGTLTSLLSFLWSLPYLVWV